jgi:uncharacterized membrane protein YoaK (UPF0700 family)
MESIKSNNQYLILAFVSGVLGLLTTNCFQKGYIPVLSYIMPILVIVEGLLLHKAIKQAMDKGVNRLLTISLVLSELLSLYFAYRSINLFIALAMGAIPRNGLYLVCSLITSVMVFVTARKIKSRTS